MLTFLYDTLIFHDCLQILTAIRHKCSVRQFSKTPVSGRTPWYLADVSDWSFMCEGCLESIPPFCVPREPVAWPWCNLEVSQRRPYCSSVNSKVSRGGSQSAVRRLSTELVYCVTNAFPMTEREDQLHHDNAPAHSRALTQAFFLGGGGKASHYTSLSAPLQPRFGSLWFLAFPKAKIAVWKEEICECDGHTGHRHKSDCSRRHSKVSSDWLQNYIKATRPVLEIFKWPNTFRTALVSLDLRLENSRRYILVWQWQFTSPLA